MIQEALLHQCDRCLEWHDDGNWALCHCCANVAFRAWYCGGMVIYLDAVAIFSGLLGKLIWRPR